MFKALRVFWARTKLTYRGWRLWKYGIQNQEIGRMTPIEAFWKIHHQKVYFERICHSPYWKHTVSAVSELARMNCVAYTLEPAINRAIDGKQLAVSELQVLMEQLATVVADKDVIHALLKA